MAEKLVISMDGPSASGKSTVARRVAELLGFIHVDSGSLYRGITWMAVSGRLGPARKQELISGVDSSSFEFGVRGRSVWFTINGVDPSPFLRSDAVRERVSDVAAIPEIRERVVRWLREMANFGNLVMEGRDIGSVVFPDARFKFYLDADPAERARRRCAELAANETTDLQSTRKSLENRDMKDSRRDAAPLKVPNGALKIDTTEMTVEEVAARIADHVRSNSSTRKA